MPVNTQRYIPSHSETARRDCWLIHVGLISALDKGIPRIPGMERIKRCEEVKGTNPMVFLKQRKVLSMADILSLNFINSVSYSTVIVLQCNMDTMSKLICTYSTDECTTNGTSDVLCLHTI